MLLNIVSASSYFHASICHLSCFSCLGYPDLLLSSIGGKADKLSSLGALELFCLGTENRGDRFTSLRSLVNSDYHCSIILSV